MLPPDKLDELVRQVEKEMKEAAVSLEFERSPFLDGTASRRWNARLCRSRLQWTTENNPFMDGTPVNNKPNNGRPANGKPLDGELHDTAIGIVRPADITQEMQVAYFWTTP